MSLLGCQTLANPTTALYAPPGGGGGGGGSVPANLAVSTLTVAGDGTGKNIFCQNSVSPNQGLYLNATANSTMSIGYSNAVGYQTYIDTGSMMPQSSGNNRWQTRFQNPVEIIPGSNGVYDFSDTSLTITNASLSVSALTDVNTINGQALVAVGPRTQLSPLISSGTSVADNSTVDIVDNLVFAALVSYRITVSSLNIQGSSGAPIRLFVDLGGEQVGLGVIPPDSTGSGYASYSATFRPTTTFNNAKVSVYNPAGNPSITINFTTTNQLWLLEQLPNVA